MFIKPSAFEKPPSSLSSFPPAVLTVPATVSAPQGIHYVYRHCNHS